MKGKGGSKYSINRASIEINAVVSRIQLDRHWRQVVLIFMVIWGRLNFTIVV